LQPACGCPVVRIRDHAIRHALAHTPLVAVGGRPGLARLPAFATGRAVAHARFVARSIVDRSIVDRSLVDRSFVDRSFVDRSIVDRGRSHGVEPAERGGGRELG
jgi:hypothetical protein